MSIDPDFVVAHFETSLTTWLTRVQTVIDEHQAYNGFNWKVQLSLERGRRYIRVVSESRNDSLSRSAFCFIDMQNGDVLKPAGWKGPTKNFPRGNIYTDELGVGPYGALTY